jgi:hypothetical protein
MPPVSDWRSSADYAYLNDLDPAELAWEFLRRNPDYQRDHRTSVKPDPSADDGSDASANAAGYDFAVDPKLTANQAPLFWLPQ